VAVRHRNGRREYRVEWEGYPEGDTWEPAENIPPELVADFENARAGENEGTDGEAGENEGTILTVRAEGSGAAARSGAAAGSGVAAGSGAAAVSRAAAASGAAAPHTVPQPPAKRGPPRERCMAVPTAKKRKTH